MLETRIQKMAMVTAMCGLLIGCIAGEKSLKYLGDADLRYYRDTVAQIDYPYINYEPSDTVQFAVEPRRLRNRTKDKIWELTLQEAIHLSLANSEIIRDNGQFLSPGNTLLTRPDFANSVYDPSIQDTGVLFGQRGVAAALADFDATFTTTMNWDRDETIQNSPNINFVPGDTLIDEKGAFRSSISKTFSNSASIIVSHNWDYLGRNQQFGGNGFLFPSSFSAQGSPAEIPTFGIEYRQPLWAGSGTQYTRIAGPVSGQVIRSVAGVAQGVTIARINNDISLADFEASVRNLVKDVEDVYWDLYLAYRTFDAEIKSRNSSLGTWRQVKTRQGEGLSGGGTADEAQARDNYFEIRARAENALANVYSTEARLRRLLVLPVNDGRIIRPVDEPLTAEFEPDWHVSLAEALTRRVELRRQKWNIKSLDLQVYAARSLTKPRLDFVSAYRVQGFGDKLLGSNPDSATDNERKFESAYQTLFRGDETGWNLGFEFSMPFGFRSALAQVRNLELRLAKARAILSTQELEISHELANAVQSLDRSYTTAQTNFNRRQAAELRVQAFEALYEEGAGEGRGGTPLDLLLRSQISLAQAEIAYFQSLIDYNKSLNEYRYRKGTLLEDNGVHLAESLSTPEAYRTALRRAWARSHALDARHLKTEPKEFAGGPYPMEVDLILPEDHPLFNDSSQDDGLPPVPPAAAPKPDESNYDASANRNPHPSKQTSGVLNAATLIETLELPIPPEGPLSFALPRPPQASIRSQKSTSAVTTAPVELRTKQSTPVLGSSTAADAKEDPFVPRSDGHRPISDTKIQKLEFEVPRKHKLGDENIQRDGKQPTSGESTQTYPKTSSRGKKRQPSWGVFWKRK